MSEQGEFAKREGEILAFWNEKEIFKKTLEKKAPKGEYVLYDGPPFATGLPHYGHLLPGTIKDVIPRYKTMRGYRVPRRWGWDCHGLPLEAQVEKVFNVSTKQEIIEEVGVAPFVEKAKEVVLQYRDDWKKIIPRTGRFVDMENDYRTMDSTYTESVWWVFKTLYDKDLIYKGFKSLHLSPLLGTELSNIEVAQGYKDIVDFAVTVALPLDGEDASLLVWTTTPWTLPGNMAAAVNKDLTYVKVKVSGSEKQDGVYIVAKDKISLFGELSHEVLEEMEGSQLVGKTYEPPFGYYKHEDFPHKENAWKVYAADYVTAEDGTGAVHLAPAFGAEDLELAQKENIPVVHHVDKNGKFVDVITDFKGLDAKPKDNHQATDIEIIKALAHSGKLFKKEKIEHSYPHSWRTDEPLLNYAMDSWFVNVPKIRGQVVAANEKVDWVPKEIGENRFGNWLKNARDWSISRSRFWGAPLPVWESEGGKRIVLGSLSDLKKYVQKSGNTYFVARHAEGEHNVQGIVSADKTLPHKLTENGRAQADKMGESLKGKNITKIFVSPFVRTKETAARIAKVLNLSDEHIVEDDRLGELGFGEFKDKTIAEYIEYRAKYLTAYDTKINGGESHQDVKNRLGEFLYELERSHKGENILIVTHGVGLEVFPAIVEGADKVRSQEILHTTTAGPGTIIELPFVPLPHNQDYELDYHRPYIDEVVLMDGQETYTRIQDVFDCWFESGSMPYGQKHYPFENTDNFEPKGGLFKKSKGYPAEFIAEGLDQTRGWFYSLLVLGVALFGRSPYKNVIVHGIVLAEDGRKMSKKLKNYPEITEVMDRQGADALRYYLLASPLMRGEDLAFSEDGVKEVGQKLLGRLHNILSFYELYKDTVTPEEGTKNVLDIWILSRLAMLHEEVTEGLESYELDKATRPFMDFVDDFSTWYIRRSRDRIKKGGEDASYALHTLTQVLTTFSKLMAPFMPFYAEHLFQTLRKDTDPESVHLCEWPSAPEKDVEGIEMMREVRRIVSTALEIRQKAGYKVRQPLRALTLPESKNIPEAYQALVREEVNVETIEFAGTELLLDTQLTPELIEKGMVREFIRGVQDARKQAGLSPHDKAILTIAGNAAFLDAYKGEIQEAANIEKFQRVQELPGSTELDLGEKKVSIRVVHA